ncbi:cyclic-phosphate processing receiver domain-containing protein [Lignipirellula cremea]|uniref:Cyclic-phosphate processing Receiver domain-containing protein n=1 Tax=Lignipirellula cremea TaxID=2528010 RepID=A0A518DP64_9BACT|nr:cyclic-phosphate processing receiver domain-containing protein [Lignipirellula cremea]QDU93629.1 hypothetical protein Pla8534_14090 [Lignipirellula cremea]
MTSAPILLWLDDERDPQQERWQACFPIVNPAVVWVKTYDAFVEWVTDHGLPDAVGFDHDLGEAQSGFDAAKWLAGYCLAHRQPLPVWSIQSANPIGKANIIALLRSFEKATRTP